MTKRSVSGQFHSTSSAPDSEIMDEPATGTAEDWRGELEISEAQLAPGDVVDSAEVMRRLDESIARLEARKAAKEKR